MGWEQKVEQLNAKKLRAAWMNERLVLSSLDVPITPDAEPSSDPAPESPGVWC